MKQLSCEMCGSTDLIKQDGVFVCQSCGTKYSIEEAKKMMVEGTVEVTGTVKVDGSDELSNLYQLARRAKDNNNIENAGKYYDMILLKDPTSWEASFYAIYYKALQCKIAYIASAADSVNNCIGSVLKLIKDHVSDKDEQISSVQDVAVSCTMISNILYDGAISHYNSINYQIRSDYEGEKTNNCYSALKIMYTLGDTVDSLFGDYEQLHGVMVSVWKNGVKKHYEIRNGLLLCGVSLESTENTITKYADKIKKYNSNYQAPSFKSGCYIATAVYGSYDCPPVWTLRRYRDYTLAKTWYGRAFIHAYYAISPTLVKWFGETAWFKKLWKGKIDRMVIKLQSQGVESTPYEDREW